MHTEISEGVCTRKPLGHMALIPLRIHCIHLL
nr:MAG TPA: hypothetical protein [Caudoviricetes sp.]